MSLKPSGSSPLTRGKLSQISCGEAVVRIIPAHAGKTFPRVELNHHETAHPRSRGENYAWCGAFQVWGGSSPLTRGKPGIARLARNRRRLIPAHAGKTGRRCPPWDPTGAHPRSRGENGKTTLVGPLQVGSSPLTRGKPSAKVTTSLSLGLIPTHARKTLRGSRPPAGSRAHPHSRGENVEPLHRVAVHEGSSPLTRGKPTDKVGGGVGDGLIPAHTGKISRP